MRTAGLLGAVTGLTGIGVLAGFLTGDLTQPDLPTTAVAPRPLLTIPSPNVTPAPTRPPALDPDSLDFRTQDVPGTEVSLTVRAPEGWDLVVLRYQPLEARFRIPSDSGRTYDLRAEQVPGTLTPDRAAKEREAQLRGNDTPDLLVLGRNSGTVTSDGLRRRYSELVYTYTEVRSRRSLLVILRWVDGVELSATGRTMDRAGLEVVIAEAAESAELAKRH